MKFRKKKQTPASQNGIQNKNMKVKRRDERSWNEWKTFFPGNEKFNGFETTKSRGTREQNTHKHQELLVCWLRKLRMTLEQSPRSVPSVARTMSFSVGPQFIALRSIIPHIAKGVLCGSSTYLRTRAVNIETEAVCRTKHFIREFRCSQLKNDNCSMMVRAFLGNREFIVVIFTRQTRPWTPKHHAQFASQQNKSTTDLSDASGDMSINKRVRETSSIDVSSSSPGSSGKINQRHPWYA